MKLDKRRRIEGRTNYKKRLALLRGNSPRFIVRKTNRYIILQIAESKDAQDKIIFSANTRELVNFGWPKEKEGSLKSLPAAYLGGLLIGKKAKNLKGRIVLDIGLVPNTKGSKIYAAAKGLKDAGANINFDEKTAPSKERIEGKNTKISGEIFNKVMGAVKNG